MLLTHVRERSVTKKVSPIQNQLTNQRRRRTSITFDVDAEVLEWLKSQVKDIQNRINAALRIYAKAREDRR